MVSTVHDLWPKDIATSLPRAPVVLLREQAALLGPKTSNIVMAKVETSSFDDTIRHDFVLVAPSLGNYKFRLFTVSHEATLYPVTVAYGDQSWRCEAEGSFVQVVGQVLSSDTTVKVVRALLAQSAGDTAEAEDPFGDQ